jgi:hypothetical protein
MAMFPSRHILQVNRKLNALLKPLPIFNLGSTAPSRLLLHLEWLLLGFSGLTMLLMASIIDNMKLSLLSLLGVMALVQLGVSRLTV